MNQQRSRRFRAAKEAEDKAQARKENILELEAMGKLVSDEYRNQTAWDSNAITPGARAFPLLPLRQQLTRSIAQARPSWTSWRSHCNIGSPTSSTLTLAGGMCARDTFTLDCLSTTDFLRAVPMNSWR